MVANEYPVLCGGTFFSLLLRARGQRTSKRNNVEGKTDGLSQTDLLIELAKIIKPTFSPPEKLSTLKKNVGGYRRCEDNGGSYFAVVFETATARAAFDNRIKAQYSSVLSDMSVLTARFIGEDYTEWLVKALMEVIETDKAFDTATFYVEKAYMTKCAFMNTNDVYLPSFLLAIWHYIVMNITNNTNGQATFLAWHKKKGEANSEWIWNNDATVGNSISKKINILPFVDFGVNQENMENGDPTCDDAIGKGNPFNAKEDCECGEEIHIDTEDVGAKFRQNVYHQTINVISDNNTVNGFVFNLHKGNGG